MKVKHIYIIGFIATLGIFSCAKERSPRLIILVQEQNGTPAVGAEVHAWPGDNFNNTTGSGVVNEEEMDKTGVTDGNGEVIFDFKYSAVLDVDVIYYKSGIDDLLQPFTDTLVGKRVVKIESERQRDSENNYNETVEVRLIN